MGVLQSGHGWVTSFVSDLHGDDGGSPTKWSSCMLVFCRVPGGGPCELCLPGLHVCDQCPSSMPVILCVCVCYRGSLVGLCELCLPGLHV